MLSTDLISRLEADGFKAEGDHFRGNCPWRAGSDSNGFIVWRNGHCFDHAHGAWFPSSRLYEHYNVPEPDNGHTRPAPTEYFYVNENGEVEYKVLRKSGKTGFPQAHFCPDHGDWQWNLGGHKDKCSCPKVTCYPYHLDKLVAAPPGSVVVICEGEKDVHTAEKLGFVATTNSGGAGKWRINVPESSYHYFEDKRVIIVGDDDKQGHDHMQDVYEELKDVAATVRTHVFEGPPGTKGYDLTDWINDGGTREALLKRWNLDPDGNSQEPLPERDDPFRLISISEIRSRPDKQYLIKHLFGRGDIGMLAGKEGAAKSSILLEMLMCVAAGKDWADGHETTEVARVVYCTDEGTSNLKERIDGLLYQFDAEEIALIEQNFMLMEAVPQLFDSGSKNAASVFIERLRGQEWDDVAVIGIDTLHNASVGGNENDNSDAGITMASVKEIKVAFNCAVWLNHHVAKATGTYRGASAFGGDLDVLLTIREQTSGLREVECTKARSFRKWPPKWLKLITWPGTELMGMEWLSDEDRLAAVSKLGGDRYAPNEADIELLEAMEKNRDWLKASQWAALIGKSYNVTKARLDKMGSRGQLDYKLTDKTKPASPTNPMLYKCRETVG